MRVLSWYFLLVVTASSGNWKFSICIKESGQGLEDMHNRTGGSRDDSARVFCVARYQA
ncbi:hypothetical protein LZ32DRAFT_32353 [Colletotrichum eremochloae]|nr:hypothetical protein LZ32DRAFT_32353 [Colletotrichum eremochloae]